MHSPTSHRHLVFPRDPPRVLWYANLFRFGARDGTAPLVTYIGGATGRETYLARSGPAPEHPVMHEFAKALATSRARFRAVDLLVCPCPLETAGQGEDGFLDHFDAELLRELPEQPSVLAFVGYSAGAGYATHLAIVNEDARALAVFGGVGATQVARTLSPVLESSVRDGRRLSVALYRNSGDGTASTADSARALTLCDVSPFPPAPGGHEFASYAANGTVPAAFRFVLDRLGEAA